MIGCRSMLLFLRNYKLVSLPLTKMSGYTSFRNISSIEITKNITLLSGEKEQSNFVNSKIRHKRAKPLVVMLPWLLAEKKHILKYADLYIIRGFDVLNVSITPWQMLWPVQGVQKVSTEILEFLHNNKMYSPLVIHGFSVGGYVWAEVLVQMAANRSRFDHILNKIVAQVWDSLADITEIPEGFPLAMFPRYKFLQTALRQYIIYHLKTFDEVATRHYERASQTFHANSVHSPALFFVSKSDPVGSERSNLRLKEKWESRGISVYWKSWDETPHVRHFHHYPEEYITELSNFFVNIGLAWEKSVTSQINSKL